MTGTTHNRRGALGILATGPIALIPALAVSQCSSRADAAKPGAVAQAIARHQIIAAKSRHFMEQEYDPAFDAYGNDKRQIPHFQTTHSFSNHDGERVTLRTDSPQSIAMVRKVVADMPYALANDPDYRDTVTELLERVDFRQSQIDQARVTHRLDEMHEKADRFGEEEAAAIRAVIETPAATLPELSLKLAFIAEHDEWGCEGVGAAVAADVRRLGEMEAANG